MHSFRAAIEAGDIGAAVALLADDVVFRSPVVFKPYIGREAVAPILHAISDVFEDFAYAREIGDDSASEHVLVFEARVGDRTLEGVDILHTDQHGNVGELVVMLRPLNATMAIAEAMRLRLEANVDGA